MAGEERPRLGGLFLALAAEILADPGLAPGTTLAGLGLCGYGGLGHRGYLPLFVALEWFGDWLQGRFAYTPSMGYTHGIVKALDD